MSSIPASFDEFNSNSVPSESTHPFENDNGYVTDENTGAFGSGSGVFAPNSEPFGFGSNGDDESNGPILPPPDEMQEEGFALREWRRQNAVVLEQKEKREKEVLTQIIEEAKEYKVSFHEKRKVTCENNKTNNREKEKLFLTNQDKFHKEVDKNYWKAIAELIPNEVPAIEKKGKKKASVIAVQGPKPGKPADLARMRQILVKLKHTTPDHLKFTPPPPEMAEAKDGRADRAVAATPEAVVAA